MSIYAWLHKFKQRRQDKISFYQQDWEIIKLAITLNMKNILAMC